MKALLGALFQASKELTSIHKDSTGQYGAYATLETIISNVKPTLEKHDLLITQTISNNGEKNTLTTSLYHVPTGECIHSNFLLIAEKPGPQGQGAAITYARRYGILAILGIATEDDPDAAKQATNGNIRDDFHRAKAASQRPPVRPASSAANSIYDWVIPFGKFKNQRIGDVKREELISYANWVDNDAKKSGKPISRDAEQLISIAAELMNEAMSDVSGFAPNSNIPF